MQTVSFPTLKEVPASARLESRDGRILVDGKIESTGFEMKTVLSPCVLRDDSGKLYHPEIGRTPNIGQDIFARAVAAARKAWAKGRGEWATARMETRIAAVAQFRDRLLPLRETIAKSLMWEIGKPW